VNNNRKEKWTHIVEGVIDRIRVSDYCGPKIAILGSKSATKKALSAGRILINGMVAKSADFLKNGDQLTVIGSGISKIKKYDIEVPIAYEDDYLIIVQKPAGIAVNGNRYKTLENALADTEISTQKDALPRPVATHRIDVPTRGLVMLAKTKSSLIELARLFKEKKIRKKYYAIVHGDASAISKIDEPIGGKASATLVRTITTVPSRVFGHMSLLELSPLTGRTHQLRIHLQSCGHLILGDKEYAVGQKTILGKGLFLCAAGLSFTHPFTMKHVNVELDVPGKFARIIKREKERYNK